MGGVPHPLLWTGNKMDSCASALSLLRTDGIVVFILSDCCITTWFELSDKFHSFYCSVWRSEPGENTIREHRDSSYGTSRKDIAISGRLITYVPVRPNRPTGRKMGLCGRGFTRITRISQKSTLSHYHVLTHLSVLQSCSPLDTLLALSGPYVTGQQPANC